MAKNSGPKKKSKEEKSAKVSFGEKIKSWFNGITSELKKVSWPEKSKFQRNLAAVLTILLISVLTILAFDSLVGLVLDVTGFYDVKQGPATVPAVAAPLEPEQEVDKAEEAEKAEEAAEEAASEAEDADAE